MRLGPLVTTGAAIGAYRARDGGGAAALLVAAVGGIGMYDDLAGDSHARGLRGHLAAARSGRLTTGLVKLLGLSAAATATTATRRRGAVNVAIDTVAVAGAANLVNLFDLRPGRASKLVAAAALLPALRGSDAATATVVVALAALPADLREIAMLGDCGAGALGALLGWTLTTPEATSRRLLAAAVILTLTLASERVSFSDVIARHAWLDGVDHWGRAA